MNCDSALYSIPSIASNPDRADILYEFSQADLSACVMYMQNHLNLMETKKRPVDWITVNYMGTYLHCAFNPGAARLSSLLLLCS